MVETKSNTLAYQDYLKKPDYERWELLNGELTMAANPNTAHRSSDHHGKFVLAPPLLCERERHREGLCISLRRCPLPE